MPPNARDDRDIDLVLPWRKAFPICKPPVPGDLGDAERFIKEFERGADRYDLDTGTCTRSCGGAFLHNLVCMRCRFVCVIPSFVLL